MRSALLLIFLLWLPSPLWAQQNIDYRYAPARWFTPIGLLDDWQKTLVDEQGQLAYDFGPGPYVHPLTTVSVDVVPAHPVATDTVAVETSQTLLDPRVPVVLTQHRRGSQRWQQAAFALIPEGPQPVSAMAPDGAYRRHEGLVGSPAWARPPAGTDPAFRSVAWGTGRSIRYDLRVPPGDARRVALGFIESYRSGRIARLMDLHVEGAASATLDLMERGSQHEPQVVIFDAQDADADGWLEVEVTPSPEGQDPNVLLSGIWAFPAEASVSAEAVISGAATDRAVTHVDTGMDLLRQGHVRLDALRTAIAPAEGATEARSAATLQVQVESLRPLTIDTASAALLFDGTPFVVTQPAFARATQTDRGWLLAFPEGTRDVDLVVVHGRLETPFAFPDLAEEQRRATAYWQRAPLPWGRLAVPDSELQSLLDGGIRTLYQVREVVDGEAQFQPGATVYRGLWYGDGSWAVETAALLDDAAAARSMLAAMLAHQAPSGRAGVMKPDLLHRETAHLIYAMCRYARLHQDWDWLATHWTQLELAMQHLVDLRAQASADPEASYFGLFPPGLTDGGIGGVGASYGSVYWGLIAMAEAVRAARALNRPEAAAWDAEFQAFLGAFRKAAQRDMRHDAEGHPFLPIKMGFDPERDLPQRGQWGPIHALYAGQFLTPTDSLVTGTLAMLDARTAQGHVVGLGWLREGLWPIFDAHRALAYNWLGDADKAEELLYAFANHATPTLLWVEEQWPQARGTRTAGDVPHTVGNMQVVRLLRYLLFLERGSDLEILAGLPGRWLRPGARLEALSLPTLFGPATLKLHVNSTGEAGMLWVQTPPGTSSAGAAPEGTVRLFLSRLREVGFTLDDRGEVLPDQIELPWDHLYSLTFRRTTP